MNVKAVLTLKLKYVMGVAKHIKSMANLILTTDCKKNCEYCFTENSGVKEFTWENFLKAVNFVAPDGRRVNLLGGEPMLHKHFGKMLNYLLNNDFSVQVFTSGMVDRSVTEEITTILNKVVLRPEQLVFAVDINETNKRSEEETKLQGAFLKSMSYLAYPAFTIKSGETDLMFLQDIIERFSLDRTIKLGLSVPKVGSNKEYLPTEEYKKVANNIKYLANNTEGTTIKFDCGFPLCMFDTEDIVELNKNKENDFVFICGQPLDIHPDLTLTNCYPLSKLHRVSIYKFDNVKDAYKYFDDGFMTPSGIKGEKCTNCVFFRKVCWGGCKGFYNKIKKENK
jgi:organic radical activating enzyme